MLVSERKVAEAPSVRKEEFAVGWAREREKRVKRDVSE